MSLTNFPLTGGLDRSVCPTKANSASFWALHNLRPDPNTRGRIVQTPRLYEEATLAQGIYWDNVAPASTTEPSASKLLTVLKPASAAGTLFDFTQYVVRVHNSTQVKVYYQSAVPTTVTDKGYCYITINDVANLGVTLGSTFDIRILVGGATFEWRINGGAYAGAFACTITGTVVSSGGTNFTVYFLAASGFTAGDVWSWKRMDSTFYNEPDSSQVIRDHVHYKSRTFYVDRAGQVMSLMPDAQSSPVYYCISVGYRPVYGLYLAVFDDHLYVGGYKATTYGSSTTSTGVVVNSDKTDLDQFFSTSTNEADSFTLPVTSKQAGATNEVVGIFVQREQLFVATYQELWSTFALGLPNVNDYTAKRSLPGIRRIFASQDIVYLWIKDDTIIHFNGVDLTNIGQPLSHLLNYGVASGTATQITAATYNRFTHEILFWSAGSSLLLCYNEAFNLWYTRTANITTNTMSGLSCVDGELYVGGLNRKVYRDDTASGQTPAAMTDTTPTLVTQAITGMGMGMMKDYVGTFMAVDTPTGLGVAYYSGTSIRITVGYYNTATGLYGTTPSTDGGTWSAADPITLTVQGPRCSFRALGLSLTVAGTDATKPPAGVSFLALESYYQGIGLPTAAPSTR